MNPNPHRETDLYFDKVIIGSSTQAMVAAFKYEIPIFIDKSLIPLPYYYLQADLDLSQINVKNNVTQYSLLSGTKEYRGIQEIELWNQMAFRLGIMGLMPLYGYYSNTFTESIPVGNNIRMFSVRTENKIVNIHSRKTILYDYPKYKLGEKTLKVNDYMELKGIPEFKADLFLSNDCDFTNTLCFETLFYKEGNKQIVCSKSIISEKDINSWKSSQTSVRLKTEHSIFWNLEKKFSIILGKRETSPILKTICDSLDEIINFDILDGEFL